MIRWKKYSQLEKLFRCKVPIWTQKLIALGFSLLSEPDRPRPRNLCQKIGKITTMRKPGRKPVRVWLAEKLLAFPQKVSLFRIQKFQNFNNFLLRPSQTMLRWGKRFLHNSAPETYHLVITHRIYQKIIKTNRKIDHKNYQKILSHSFLLEPVEQNLIGAIDS